MSFSVSMSVYAKENASYLRQCLDSLASQTLPPSEVVLVEDGEITKELADVISYYSDFLPIKNVRLERNQGLAAALNIGLEHCSNELIARMDTDDVCLPNRFARQVAFMQNNPDISVSSAWIVEMNQSMTGAGVLKMLPESHADVMSFSKLRNPINHPVSIFRKSSVLLVGGYPLIYPEDYALWAFMLTSGFKFANIPEVLLKMRTGEDFISRRGMGFFKKEIVLLRYFRSIGFFGLKESAYYFLTRLFLRVSPPKIRMMIYKSSR